MFLGVSTAPVVCMLVPSVCLYVVDSSHANVLALRLLQQTPGLYVELIATIEGHYWLPGFKEEEIYQQMASHHYQEFDGECIELLTKVGEGEFGEVYKAVLKTPTGTSQDVAVKVVKKGAPQEERLKLLQEAAILGLFRHRHVVDMKGIVRDELVSTHAVNGEGASKGVIANPFTFSLKRTGACALLA